MGSYGSQSVARIGALMAHEAEMKAQQKKQEEVKPYRMPDEQVVTVIMPVGLIRKMVKPWYLMKKDEAEQVRSAMRHALWDEHDVKSGL